MRNSSFLTKKISASGKIFGLFLLKTLIRFYKFLFTKRTILFVTNQKIRSFTLGPVLQACILLFFFWVGNLFIQSIAYDKIVSAKVGEVEKLKAANDYFEDEFEDLNEKLAKLNEYINSLNGNKQSVKAPEVKVRDPKGFKEEDLSRDDKHTFNQIKEANQQLASIRLSTSERISKIENIISITGLNIKKPAPKFNEKPKEVSLNDKKGIADRQGGPLIFKDSTDKDSLDLAMQKIAKSQSEDDFERRLENAKFGSEIDHLIVLENLIRVLPLSRPMKNYYISSGFGSRTDPLTHRHAIHQGLDFVGPNKEKIISPSRGKVILAGRFSDYGNAVVIDHGHGITTRYGHLSEVKVSEGQMVEKGQFIATQGSTGRSTGSHLHYEVRYKNTPLNPRKFLEAGEALFGDDKNSSYAI